MSLTIVIPNRNRDFKTVSRSLNSIALQAISTIEIVIIDYGSELIYQQKLQDYVDTLDGVSLILCPTQGQLWQKTRAINIVLKQCKTPYFMVADMDMIFHPDFAIKIRKHLKQQEVTYFKVGILTQEESALEKSFEDYNVKFYTNEEATGMTLFPTNVLKNIGGFDEFYHGWGAEDTDVHVRLLNSGIPVHFYKEDTLLLHQWHPKYYRSLESKMPFHDTLEQINHSYIKLARKFKKQQANVNQAWGILPKEEAYKALQAPTAEIHCTAIEDEIKALVFHWKDSINDILHFTIKPHPEQKTAKTLVKRVFRKKRPLFMTMDEVNKYLLESIILEYRNCPYFYSFDRQKNQIEGTIYLKPLGV